jgi:hypothetical protein
MKTANRTVEFSKINHPNSSKSNAVLAVFGLDWFGLRFCFLIDSDMIISSLDLFDV